MATRFSLKHDAQTREKIQTSQIINRLNSFINGEVKMENSQVTAALGLLKKTLPDLSAIELSTDPDSPLEFTQLTPEQLSMRQRRDDRLRQEGYEKAKAELEGKKDGAS
jgi:hypothetical protein